MTATVADAGRLLHEGAVTLARVTANGVAVDLDYLAQAKADTQAKIAALEERLLADDVWRAWKDRFKGEAKLSAPAQLEEVVFDVMGHPRSGHVTDKGKASSEEAAFRHVLHAVPFLSPYFRWKKLIRGHDTYLLGIEREQVGGLLHPNFPLTTATSYRSSSRDPNFQNLPARDPELSPLVRRCFVPRAPGRCLVEVDLSGAEVRVGYCNHLDPAMHAYLTDPSTDMHRDAAADLFGLDRAWLAGDGAKWAKKNVRDWGKNRFVFPQFYGSSYFQCATHLWEAVTERADDGGFSRKLPDGTTVLDHLAKQGVTSLGACDPRQPPAPGTFEERVHRAEKSLWKSRFTGYDAWRDRVWQDYQRTGEYRLLTGFRCRGLYRRNQVICNPIQGASFHVLLWSLCRVVEWIDRHKVDALVVGQIHDSVIADVAEDCVEDYLDAVLYYLMVGCPRAWPWVVIDLECEAEVCPPGADWSQKRVWSRDGAGNWAERN